MRLLPLIVTVLFCLKLTAGEPVSNPSVKELVACVKEKGSDPKDYIFDLFKKSDIVVIGERDHRDTTQYNLILDILGDTRFTNEIGYVYTEVGSNNMTAEVNRLLQGNYSSDSEFTDSLFNYYRKSETFYVLWEKYNRMKFLKGIYDINRSSENKIWLGLTDCRFSWSEMQTPEDYAEFWKSRDVNYRDSLMCANFAEMFENQPLVNGKRKALVITNRPHAINYTFFYKGWNQDFGTQGWWMKKRFGDDNVKIVALNWFDYVLFNGENYPMTGKGSWDAAFETLECKPFGIDLKGTPFGGTRFYGLSGGVARLIKDKQWEEIADGLIYYTPLYDQVAAIGIEGLVPEDFAQEIERRVNIYNEGTGNKIPAEAFIKEYNTFRAVPATFISREQSRQLILEVLNAE